jgi:hypothetical protein
VQLADRHADRLVLLASRRVFGREAARSEALLHAEGKAGAGQAARSTDAIAKLLLRSAARFVHLGSHRQGTDSGAACGAAANRSGFGDVIGMCGGTDIVARSISATSHLALYLAVLSNFAAKLFLALR